MGYICVAGIDVKTGQHVRPIPRGTELRYRDLAAHQGFFEIGSIVDIGDATPKGQPPETEDFDFLRRESFTDGEMNPAEFWNVMKSTAKTSFIEIFGDDLKPVGHQHAAVQPGCGKASLGTLLITKLRPELTIETIERRDRIRMKIKTGRIPLNLSVTDIRLYWSDHITPDRVAVAATQERLATSDEILLGVGLTRAYVDWLSNKEPLHWLQVNGIHFIEDPIRRLPEGPDPSVVS